MGGVVVKRWGIAFKRLGVCVEEGEGCALKRWALVDWRYWRWGGIEVRFEREKVEYISYINL